MECPLPQAVDVCSFKTCSSNEDCVNGQLCCSTGSLGCGFNCLSGVPLTPLCPGVRGIREAASVPTTDVFLPSCEEDGSFSTIQCYNSYCWCVDVLSGQPLTEGSEDNTLDCPQCTGPNGEEIRMGENFRTTDNCNTW